jgi:hypothetical protein
VVSRFLGIRASCDFHWLFPVAVLEAEFSSRCALHPSDRIFYLFDLGRLVASKMSVPTTHSFSGTPVPKELLLWRGLGGVDATGW